MSKADPNKQERTEGLAMPVDKDSSLFDMTPAQHQKMVEQLRADFVAARVPATGQTAPVDQAKGNALLKKLFGSKLPIVNDPTPPTNPEKGA